MQSEALYKQYSGAIHRYLISYVGEADAEELLQEVFLKVDRHHASFRGEASVRNWIYRIATNTAKDYLKSRYKKERDAISDVELEAYNCESLDSDSPEAVVLTDEMNRCIKEFIHRLPQNYATVLLLSDLEGHKLKDISEILEVTLSTAKVRLHRARARLKDEMAVGCVITTDGDNRMVCERKEK